MVPLDSGVEDHPASVIVDVVSESDNKLLLVLGEGKPCDVEVHDGTELCSEINADSIVEPNCVRSCVAQVCLIATVLHELSISWHRLLDDPLEQLGLSRIN